MLPPASPLMSFPVRRALTRLRLRDPARLRLRDSGRGSLHAGEASSGNKRVIERLRGHGASKTKDQRNGGERKLHTGVKYILD
jgi:hypothetical protein